MIGFINNVDDAASTSEFLQGAGWQASVVMPVTPLIGVGGGVNHSYGGATSIELGIGTPGAGAAPFGYGFELEKKDGKP
jgi:filamentous hemagglutinin